MNLPSRDPPSSDHTLAQRALALKHAADAGRREPLLRGKHLGLLCEAPDSADAQFFHAAATELGAQVARIRPSVAGLGHGPELLNTAVWLGRLYDAVQCEGLPPDLVARIRAAAGVPVLDGRDCPSNAALRLVQEGDADTGAARRYLLQARLASLLS